MEYSAHCVTEVGLTERILLMLRSIYEIILADIFTLFTRIENNDHSSILYAMKKIHEPIIRPNICLPPMQRRSAKVMSCWNIN
jgi:hypothetical protein